MSSTDEAALRRFLATRLAPAAAKLRKRGVSFFPRGPDPGDRSWYEPAPSEAELCEVEPEGFEAELRERWERQGLPELAALAAPLLQLAQQLEIAEEESAEISPFVYVMY